jgi:hypothetical protein
MTTEGVLPRGGCRFIRGDPQAIHELGEAIYCRKPVTHEGGVWCAEHQRVVYTTIEKMREAREAA